MRALILGAGNMGRAVRDAAAERAWDVVGPFGRPDDSTTGGRPEPASLGPIDMAFEFSHAAGVLANVRYAVAARCRRIIVGTTGWADDRSDVARVALEHGAAVVHGPTFSLGAVLFGELAEAAARLFGDHDAYDPYVFEWHRRAKADRPSGTALALAERMLPHLVAKTHVRRAGDRDDPAPADALEVTGLRAGASPGQHIVGFDGEGETIELRITARDRSAYVAGAMLAAERLLAGPPLEPGLHAFADLVLAGPAPSRVPGTTVQQPIATPGGPR